MLVVAILHVKNIGIKIKNTYRNHSTLALFSLDLWAKIMWVLASMGVKNNEIIIENTWKLYSNSAFFFSKILC
jgi:hypothetical protein